MERQRIKEQLGVLAEHLERLESLGMTGADGISPDSWRTLHEASSSLTQLQSAVLDQSLQKSLPAQEFLQRVSGVLIREARAQGLGVSLVTCGRGRISLEMVEISMAAVLACLRASLKSHQGVTAEERGAKRLFATQSFYLEACAGGESVYFRLGDDGAGYSADPRHEAEHEKYFQRIRAHVAKYGGWFQRRSLKVGGMIEFKVPMPASRFECVAVRQGDFSCLLPASCVSEVRRSEAKELSGVVAKLDEARGLVLGSGDEAGCALKIGVADFQFWLLCDEVSDKQRARRVEAGDLVEPSSWFRSFGIYHEGGSSAALPFVDGETLMNFFTQAEGKK